MVLTKIICSMKKTYTKIIGVSGGPCSGKTILINYIANILTNAGHRVHIVPEAATILITAGEQPGSIAFQRLVFKKVLELEKIAIEQAKRDGFMGKIFILCDRTLLDGNGYITDEEFLGIVAEFNMTIADICNRYDAIIYLETAAKGAPGFFGKETNDKRYENTEEAAITCERTIKSCSRHPYFIRIYNDGGTFSQKLFKAYQCFCKLCELPIPLSDTNAKRFYIAMFNKKMFTLIGPKPKHVVITQYYLKNEAGAHKPPRLRSKLHEKTEIFFYTRERQTGIDEYTQVEEIIPADQLDELLTQIDPTIKKIKKDRYSYFSDGNLYELDVFNEHILHKGKTGNALLKITPTTYQAEIILPDIFKPLVVMPLEARDLTDYMIARK